MKKLLIIILACAVLFSSCTTAQQTFGGILFGLGGFGVIAGSVTGALIDAPDRQTNAILGGLIGAGIGVGVGTLIGLLISPP